jgi:hypothetical protein
MKQVEKGLTIDTSIILSFTKINGQLLEDLFKSRCAILEKLGAGGFLRDRSPIIR